MESFMAEQQKINAAYRLHILLQNAVAQNPQALQLQIWANVFELQNLMGRQQKESVARGIILMFGQLDRVVEQLRALEHPENTYRPLVVLMEQNVLIEMIHHPWGDFPTRLTNALYPLFIFSTFLPDDENLVDPKEFQVIREELDKLEKSLADKEISPEVRTFVKRQIDRIRHAMWEYKFRGAQAFQDAMLQTFSDYTSSDVVPKHEKDPPVQKVGHVWQSLMKVMDSTIKVQGTLTAVQKIYQLAESVGIHHHLK
jgi:hypothetical protein